MPTIDSVGEAVSAASRDRVVRSFARLKTHWNAGRWLGPRNYYRLDTSNRVKNARGHSEICS